MEIANLKVYNDNMRKSLLDKAYFLSFVDSDTFIDFGCADGSLLKHIHEMFPDKKLIGYDISPEMLQVAEKNLEGCNVSLYNNFENVISLKLDNATLILSSVIHEVYSYGDNQSVNEFWRQVFNENFRYIAIRDLTPRKSIDRMSDINDVSRVLHNANPTHLAEFQSIWGNISNNKNLVHFLMKYKWVENWAREVRENYFPITIEEFLSKVPNNYVIDYFYEFIMPRTQQGILKDFNILLTEEVNSSNKNWLNSDSRHCDILVRSDDAETIKYSGTLSQSQVEHIVFLIQDNYSAKDIKDQIIEYGVQNLSPTVTPQIGDPEFLEE